MAILHLAIVNEIMSLPAWSNVAALNDLGYSIERITKNLLQICTQVYN